jgi:sulfonate transport system substrate-binding protein
MGSGSHLMARVDAHLRNLKIKDDQWMIVQNLEGAKTALSEQSADLFLWEKWMTRPLVDAGILKMIDERPTPWSCFLWSFEMNFSTKVGRVNKSEKW